MRRPKQQCPGCESEQSFPLRQRDSDDEGIIEVYIACTTCLWEKAIRKSTTAAELLRVRLAHARAQRDWQQRRHGIAFAGTLRAIEILERELAREKVHVD